MLHEFLDPITGIALASDPGKDPIQLSLTKTVLDLRYNPTCVILDLGCTRPMGSRPAIERFRRIAHKFGLKTWIESTNSKFTFANGQVSYVTETLVIFLPVEPPVTTRFDIVEEGNVPLLMSLYQMMNLGFNLELTPQ